MKPYIYTRNKEGIHYINLAKSWEKLMIAARVIAAVTNKKRRTCRIKQNLRSKSYSQVCYLH